MDTSACVIGMSEAMRALRYDVELAARSSVNVLISGESGVGKQTLARRIHQRSARASRRLSVVDGARMRYPYELQVVLFHCSEGGTLLLESVSELAPAVQQELLASLTGRRSHDGPARRWQLADVRLIACTHPKIADQLASCDFLEDLYYRLNTIHLLIPPVRERPDDIPALVRHFLRQKAAETNRPVLDVSAAAMSRFVAYDWPGNLSEIQEVMDVLASSDLVRSTIHAYSLPTDLARISAVTPEPADTFLASSVPMIEVNSTSESLLEFSSETTHDSRPQIPWFQRVAAFGTGVVAGGMVALAVMAGIRMQAWTTHRVAGAALALAPKSGPGDSDATELPGGTRLSRVATVTAVSSDASQEPAIHAQPAIWRESYRGSLVVTSFPSGAQVRLNGRPAGKTPLVLKNLPVGSRAVRLELDRYQPWSSAVQVVTNQRAHVIADLHLAATR